jgi:hypothetical protein
MSQLTREQIMFLNKENLFFLRRIKKWPLKRIAGICGLSIASMAKRIKEYDIDNCEDPRLKV